MQRESKYAVHCTYQANPKAVTGSCKRPGVCLSVCLSLLATGTFVDCPVPNGGDPLFGDADGCQCQPMPMPRNGSSRVCDPLEPGAGLQMSTCIAADGARAHLSGGEIAGSRGGAVTGMGFPRCDGAMDKRESVGAGEAGDGVRAGDEMEDGGAGVGAGAIARAGEEKGDGLERWRLMLAWWIRRVLGRGGGVDVLQQCSRSRVMDGWVSLPRLGRKQGGASGQPSAHSRAEDSGWVNTRRLARGTCTTR